MGGIVQAVGQISQGVSASEAASYNAGVARRSATVARQQAEADAAMQQAQATQILGSQRAGYAASGIAMEGSALDVLYNSASVAERDRQNILYKGALKAQGYEDQAALESARASSLLLSGYMNAGSGLLNSATQGFVSGYTGAGGRF